ncbi:hypothetical protein G4Y79_14475 [Phototrophicus methaneseepsis]|uniref:Uncharacterized protein n=1 Tax=Phototrophicus methaneseepsis TaxID=2710758 RepID=A0A7S8ICW8_9CHLR|nr:hypothetical protein [Phototrophicus methaneseepsis]QPC80911.1 hypothetical protein G4Y79_14475 [Phototrophicus methaneseepsis]
MTTSNTIFSSDTYALDWLSKLRTLLRDLHRPDIRSVDALLSKLTGDANAALMLLRLLYWTPKSKRDGWIYKSWRDWNAECNLSQSQIKRVHSQQLLEAIGIVREIRKANGVPTMHYRLDAVKFLQKLSAFLAVEIEQLAALFEVDVIAQLGGAETPKPSGDNRLNDVVPTAKPITDINQQALPTDSTNTQTTAPVDDIKLTETDLSETNLLLLDLVDLGFDLVKAHGLVGRYDIDSIRQVLERAKQANAYNPPGFVLTALKQAWDLPPAQKQQNASDALLDGKRYAQGKYADFIES